jgi:hypothetical protein
LENIHCWIEQLDPTVNVLQAAQIDPLGPSISATLKPIWPVDLLLKDGENGAGESPVILCAFSLCFQLKA